MRQPTRSHSLVVRFGLLALLAFGSITSQAQDQWPVVFTANGDEVQVFTPQPESYDGSRVSMRAAVALKRSTDKEPVFGAIWGQGTLEVDRGSRMGKLTSFNVTDARMPGLETAELNRFKETLSAEIPKHTAPIAIDWIVSALENEQQHSDAYVNDPPAIIYRETPSVLVYIDGEPVYEPVKGTTTESGDPVYGDGGNAIERVMNTPFFLVREKGGDHYLYGSGLWYRSKDVKGPWKRESNAPSAMQALAKQVDATAELAPAASDGSVVVPEVVVSTVPAELLDLKGSPQFKPLPETGLLYATNTSDDLFMDITTQDYYLLASGRWFATSDLKGGPWRYVESDRLPTAFAKIPEGSAKDGALAHIAGTRAATEAVRDASIPQTASVDRSTATVQVSYDGDPRFERVDGTNIYQAVNASTTVLRIDGRYHVCDNAVWFEGDTPDGPWVVSTVVPAEVNTIPPSSPIYNVRYVYIYDYTPNVVFTGYTPGYLGCYVQGGTVIYGTGYYYAPWPGYWRPRPYTWGFNMYYDPWIGWGYGMGWGYNWFYPAWGGYGHYHPYGCGWWGGPWGYYPPVYYSDGYGQGHGHYYGHRSDVSGGRRSEASGTAANSDATARMRPANLYASRADAGVRPSIVDRGTTRATPTDRAGTKPPTEERGGTKTPTTQPNVKPMTRDHFTDAQGNVYRREEGGTQQYTNGRWTKVPPSTQAEPARTQPAQQPPVQRPTQPPVERPTQPQTKPQERPTNQPPVVRDPQRIQQDRQRGEQRTNDMNQYRQQRTQPPAARPAPQRSQPQQRSAPSSAPRSSPGSAPSRGGGGRSKGR